MENVVSAFITYVLKVKKIENSVSLNVLCILQSKQCVDINPNCYGQKESPHLPNCFLLAKN